MPKKNTAVSSPVALKIRDSMGSADSVGGATNPQTAPVTKPATKHSRANEVEDATSKKPGVSKTKSEATGKHHNPAIAKPQPNVRRSNGSHQIGSRFMLQP